MCIYTPQTSVTVAHVGTGDSVQLKIFIPVTSQGQTGNNSREWEESFLTFWSGLPCGKHTALPPYTRFWKITGISSSGCEDGNDGQCMTMSFFFSSLSVTSHRDKVPGLLSHEFRISINVLSLTVNRANFQFIKTAGGDVKGLCCLYRAVLGQYSDHLQHFQALFWLFEGYRSWQKYSIVVL